MAAGHVGAEKTPENKDWFPQEATRLAFGKSHRQTLSSGSIIRTEEK